MEGILSMNNAKMYYFEKEDILHLIVSDEPEANSVEISPNITAELNDEGELIGIEIINASSFLRDSILESVQGKLLTLAVADIELINPKEQTLKPMKINALVDTGAITLCIPEHIVLQLKLEALEQREVTTADGKKRLVPYVGPVQIRFENRNCFTGALVLGDSVLLGAVPLEDMDLVINPRLQTITVNPESPNIPAALVKCSCLSI